MSAVFTNRILPFSSGEQSGALAIARVVLGDLWLTILNLWGWDLDSKAYDFYFFVGEVIYRRGCQSSHSVH